MEEIYLNVNQRRKSKFLSFAKKNTVIFVSGRDEIFSLAAHEMNFGSHPSSNTPEERRCFAADVRHGPMTILKN